MLCFHFHGPHRDMLSCAFTSTVFIESRSVVQFKKWYHLQIVRAHKHFALTQRRCKTDNLSPHLNYKINGNHPACKGGQQPPDRTCRAARGQALS